MKTIKFGNLEIQIKNVEDQKELNFQEKLKSLTLPAAFFFVIFLFFIVSFLKEFYFTEKNPQSVIQNQAETQPQENIEVTENKISDIDRLASYHREIMAVINPINSAVDKYKKAAEKAVNDFNLYELYDVAKTLKAETSTTSLNPSPPTLENAKANENLQQIPMLLSAYQGAIDHLADDVMAMANEGVTPASVSRVKEDNELLDKAAVYLAVQIASAYNALGYDIEKVDIKNGGLLPGNK